MHFSWKQDSKTLIMVIIAAVVMGLYTFAVIDGIVFLLLFAVWFILRRK